MTKAKQLKLNEEGKVESKRKSKREKEILGRRGMLILFLVTTILSLALYLAQKFSSGVDYSFKLDFSGLKLGGVEEISFEK